MRSFFDNHVYDGQNLGGMHMHQVHINLPAYYLLQLVDTLSALGVDTESWLRDHHLQAAQFEEGSVELGLDQFRDLIEDALQRSQEPALGLLVGASLQAHTHGILGYAAMNSTHMRQGLELLERFISLRTDLVRIERHTHAGQLQVHFIEAADLGQARRHILQAIMLAIHNIIGLISMGSPLAAVVFPFAAGPEESLAQDLFACPVRYDQDWAGFIIHSDALERALPMADPAMFQEAARLCQREFDQRQQKAALSQKIMRLLLQKQGHFPSLTVMARLHHMSARTLHRRLLVEGTSYRAILDEVRQNLANEYLKTGKLTQQEIAYALGYNDSANFRRALRRWRLPSGSTESSS